MDATTSDRTPDTTAVSPTGLAVLPEGRPLKLSPINRRRWENFKANRRGYWSFWVFLALFFLSLGAEFIANDRPLFVSYDGRWYYPVF
ncbi:MAG: ABC transporter permease, partial [Rhodoplanes sp.]